LCLAGAGNLTTGDLYFHSNPLLRRIFWKRLETVFAAAPAEAEGPVLDLGCGGGELLPSLAGRFPRVAGLDRDIANARRVTEHFRLMNVELLEGDFLRFDFSSRRFSCVIAADVLEHQRELDMFIRRIHSVLEPEGVLVVCVPNEYFLYRLGRVIFRINPPPDHYHRCSRIMDGLRKYFSLGKIAGVPGRFVPLFRVIQCRRKKTNGPGCPD